jgi:protein-arginine kinase
LPIVLADAVCRPLALLKNCRLLTPAEFLDLLSPMRLAAIEGLLDGITLDEIDQLISEIELRDDKEDEMKNFDVDYDMVDSERANFANARFENVILSDKAEELFR